MGAGTRLIYLLRHGKPDFPGGKSYIYGHTDYPLSPEGEGQAARMAEVLAKVPLQRVVSSDLARAHDTAKIVMKMQRGANCRIELDSRLREINMGEWDGLETDTVRTTSAALFAERGKDFASVAPPGGESFKELGKRGVSALYSILETSGTARNILLVAHGGLFWAILCELFTIPLAELFRFEQSYCALHLMEYRPNPAAAPCANDFKLVHYNWNPEPGPAEH